MKWPFANLGRSGFVNSNLLICAFYHASACQILAWTVVFMLLFVNYGDVACENWMLLYCYPLTH